MRNVKYKNEPPGLTGSALGSWRHNKMLQLRREGKNKDGTKKKFKDYPPEVQEHIEYRRRIRKEEELEKTEFVFVEDNDGYTIFSTSASQILKTIYFSNDFAAKRRFNVAWQLPY
jgi:hypothetical protein